MTTAFAVIEKGGQVNMRSVSDTVRSVQVNWLVVSAGIPITNAFTDSEIDTLWNSYKGIARIAIVKIEEK